MNPRDRLTPLRAGLVRLSIAANDAAPFDGVGPGDWCEQWVDQRLHTLFEGETQSEPSPRMAELLRRLAASLELDRRG